MAADNEPAEPALRANTLKTTAAALAERLPAHVVDDGGADPRRPVRHLRVPAVAGRSC